MFHRRLNGALKKKQPVSPGKCRLHFKDGNKNFAFFSLQREPDFHTHSFALLFSPSVIYSKCFYTRAFPLQHVWMNELQCISYKSLMRLDVNTTIQCYKHNTTTSQYINSFCNICFCHLHLQTHIWPNSYEPSLSFFSFFVCFLKRLHD